jgi:hypothetical protein
MAGAGILLKLFAPDAPWGLSYRAGTVQPLAPALSTYCEAGRLRPLVIFDVADDLYAATLPLPSVRYTAIGPPSRAARYGMPFHKLGIIVTVSQFNHLEDFEPEFRDQLREWGTDSGAPIATLITADSPEELGELVRAHPLVDFLVPESYRAMLANSGHVQVPAAPGYYFLLARIEPDPQAPPPWTCRM